MSDDEGEPTYSVVFDSEPGKSYPYLPPLDGQATATYPNKDKFVGEFKDGKKTGQGCYTFGSGAKYDGEYFENKKQGKGTYFAPDGGKYVGEWYADKRHGKGEYTYPTGDRYVGEWKNGTKHGRGTYIYANISTSVTGTWSNGQCVDGQWCLHDGCSYTGTFLGNQPAGDGLFEFANGNKAAGRYQDGQFRTKSFVRPHPDATPPAVVKPSALRVAERLVDKSISKCDANTNMHVLKLEIAGVANYRRVGNTPVYACGQPSLDAYRKLNDQLTEAGFDKVVSCCLREDPVVYVDQLSFAPRDRKALNTPITLPEELTTANIKDLETRMTDNTKFAVKRKGGLHDYFEEMYANPEMPNICTGNDQKTIAVKDPAEIRSISQVFEFLGEEDVAFEYQRIPLPEEAAPTPAQFDAVATVVRGLESGAVVFNDAAGTGRATTACTIAALLVKEPEAEDAGGDEEDEGDEAKGAKGPKQPPAYDELDPNRSLGQYEVIMALVRKINGPNAEELEAAKIAEKEQYRAEKEAKKLAEAEAKAAAAAEAAAAVEGDDVAAVEGEAAPAEPAEETEEAAPAAEEAGEEEGAKEEVDDFVSKLPAEPSNLGDVLKMEVDDAIQRCGAVINLRTAILDIKGIYDQVDLDQKDVLKERAMNFVERYFHLIVFNMYANEQKALGEEGFTTTFAAWAEGKTELFDILGNRTDGPLSRFDWV